MLKYRVTNSVARILLAGRYRAFAHQLSTGNIIEKEELAGSSSQDYRTKHQIYLKNDQGNEYVPIIDFKSSPFSAAIKKVFLSEGFESPTPIQAQSWPIILDKRDMISVARTGSGKTVGFLLPAFQQLSTKNIHKTSMKIAASRPGSRRQRHAPPSVLVLAPTRELTMQIEVEAAKYSRAAQSSSVCIYGGVGRFPQIQRLREGVDIVIATPGRCFDLFEAGVLDLSGISYLVLDEADRMLDMGE
jgi:superfamily II DNA/RNA helicase